MINVPLEYGSVKKIKFFWPSTGKKLRGVYAAADRNMKSQLQHLKHKIDECLTEIEDGHLPRGSLWTAFFGTIWRTIMYALPVTTIPMVECGDLMRPIFVRLISISQKWE